MPPFNAIEAANTPVNTLLYFLSILMDFSPSLFSRNPAESAAKAGMAGLREHIYYDGAAPGPADARPALS